MSDTRGVLIRAARFVRSKTRASIARRALRIDRQGELRRPLVLMFGTQDQILFAKRLSMILRSGMPITEGLHMLNDDALSRSGVFVYQSLIRDVTCGRTLSSGLARFERIFGMFCISIVRVGEVSGTLHQNLEYLAEELKRRQILRSKVIGALIYPALIMCATVGITLLLTLYIFPKIVPIFASVKATLPVSTRMLMAISSFLATSGGWLLGALTLGIAVFVLLLRNKRFRFAIHYLVLRMPLLGSLARYYNLANISRTMSLLLRSDVRILEAIELAAASTNNLVYRRELVRAQQRLFNGQKISQQFRHDPLLFPGIMVQMVAVGERTGNLSATFDFLSDMYEEDIHELSKNLTTMLEPVLMICMGVVVGFIAISIITPIYSITQNLSAH